MVDDTQTATEASTVSTDAGGAQPELAAAMTGHQVWTSIHPNDDKAAEPEAAAVVDTEAKAVAQPDDKGADV